MTRQAIGGPKGVIEARGGLAVVSLHMLHHSLAHAGRDSLLIQDRLCHRFVAYRSLHPNDHAAFRRTLVASHIVMLEPFSAGNDIAVPEADLLYGPKYK